MGNGVKRTRRYVRAMLKAIDKAREPVWDFDVQASQTDGLRVIQRFERVNKVRFDPFNEAHLEAIAGNASHENFLRRAAEALPPSVPAPMGTDGTEPF